MSIRLLQASNSSATNTVTITLPLYSSRPRRLLKVFANFYGGATDAAMISLSIATPGGGTVAFKINVEHGNLSAGPPFGYMFDLLPGILVDNGNIPVLSCYLVTGANALATVAPTNFAVQCIYIE
jgi:hypothetical protein